MSRRLVLAAVIAAFFVFAINWWLANTIGELE